MLRAYRVPKRDLLTKIAEALNVSRQNFYTEVPDCTEDFMRTFFWLDGVSPGSICLFQLVHNSGTVAEKEWGKQTALLNGKFSRAVCLLFAIILLCTGLTQIVSIQYYKAKWQAKNPVFMRICAVFGVIPTQCRALHLNDFVS